MPTPNALITQAGLTALVPSPTPIALITQAGMTALVLSPLPSAQITQVGITVLIPTVPYTFLPGPATVQIINL
jgi:hypothetical protein